MKEYIEREAAVSELNRIEKLYQNTYMSNVRAEMASYCCQVIKHIPAADVVEVKLLDDGTLIVTTDKYPNVTRVFVEDGKTSGSLFYAEEE